MAQFPLHVKVPPYDHRGGMRQFGWSRSGGRRLHAGCDLYAPIGTPVYAIADGTFQWRRGFYDGTDQIVIYHPGIGVVRYGEVMSKSDYRRFQSALRRELVTSGEKATRGTIAQPHLEKKIEEGQIIGAVGDLRSLRMSMVHFELYAEYAKGEELGGHRNIYRRHPGLLDPTKMLQALEKDGTLVSGEKPSGKSTKPSRRKRRKRRRAALDERFRRDAADRWMFERSTHAE